MRNTARSALRTRLGEIASDFAPSHLAATLVGGTVVGILGVALSISFAALVFTGDLESALPAGIGLALFGTLVIGVITAVGSSLPGAVAGVQDNTSAVIAVSTSGLAAGVAFDQLVPTVIAYIVLASLLVGIGLAGLGAFRLGGLVRYIPFPVIGGFIVATGVLILQGAGKILFGEADGLFTATALGRWVPGAAIGLFVFLAGRHRLGKLVVPWAIMGAILLAHISFALGGIGQEEATQRGWLLGPFGDQAIWGFDTLRALGDADWSGIAGQWGGLATVVALAAISVMLYVHALEQAVGFDLDVDHELRVAGVAAAAGSLGGGMPGFVYLSDTTLLAKIAGSRRGAALVAAVMCGIAIVVGGAVLRLVPTAVIGGLLLSLGLSFTIEWLWDMRSRLQRSDYALVMIIGGAVLVIGFLPAIGLGTAIAVVLFVVRYSRVDAVRHRYTLASIRSAVDRSPEREAVLAEHGSEAMVLEVRGYLFFGTAHRVFEDPALDDRDSDIRFVVFDLARITGIDSSASTAFAKLARHARARRCGILLAAMPDAAHRLLSPIVDAEPGIQCFTTVDEAIEWCEDQILSSHQDEFTESTTPSLGGRLTAVLGSRDRADAVLRHFERLELRSSEVVIHQGRPAPGLFFIESGTLTACFRSTNGSVTRRLRTMRPGSLIGEISLYQGGDATAEVIAEGPASVLHLSSEALAELERTDPTAAVAVHRLAAHTLAGRIIHAEQAIRALRD